MASKPLSYPSHPFPEQQLMALHVHRNYLPTTTHKPWIRIELSHFESLPSQLIEFRRLISERKRIRFAVVVCWRLMVPLPGHGGYLLVYTAAAGAAELLKVLRCSLCKQIGFNTYITTDRVTLPSSSVCLLLFVLLLVISRWWWRYFWEISSIHRISILSGLNPPAAVVLLLGDNET